MKAFPQVATITIVFIALCFWGCDSSEAESPESEPAAAVPATDEDIAALEEQQKGEQQPDFDELISLDEANLSMQFHSSHGAIPDTDFDELFVEFQLEAPEEKPEVRPPLNLALVIDRSGSMRGDAMSQARQAARSFVEELEAQDRISLVSFGADSTVDVASVHVDDEGRPQLLEAIDKLNSGGMTYLSGGLRDGVDELREHSSPATVDRVVLMTDGVPNVGISDREGLLEKTSTIRQQGVSLTSLGFGTDYDAELMGAMANEGTGNYQYIADPEDFQRAFATELDNLFSTVASQVHLDLKLADGVHFDDVYGYNRQEIDGGVRIAMGDIFAGDNRSAVVRLRVDEGSVASASDLLSVEANYLDRLTDSRVHGGYDLTIARVDDQQQVEESVSSSVMGRVWEIKAQEAISDAMAIFNDNDRQRARALLDSNIESLQNASEQYGIPQDVFERSKEHLMSAKEDVQELAPRSRSARHRSNQRSQDTIEIIR